MKRTNPIKDKSFAFAIRVVKASKFLSTEHKEFVMSKQLLRSGTAVGALYREAEQAESLFIKWQLLKKSVTRPCIGWSFYQLRTI